MKIDLTGRVAVITGGNRGLGKSMALALAGAGAKIALVARDREKLDETATVVRQFGAGHAVSSPTSLMRRKSTPR